MRGGVRGAGGGMVFISCWEARRRNFQGGQKKSLWGEMGFATRLGCVAECGARRGVLSGCGGLV